MFTIIRQLEVIAFTILLVRVILNLLLVAIFKVYTLTCTRFDLIYISNCALVYRFGTFRQVVYRNIYNSLETPIGICIIYNTYVYFYIHNSKKCAKTISQNMHLSNTYNTFTKAFHRVNNLIIQETIFSGSLNARK